MGCGAVRENIIIEVTYCGGCGWTKSAGAVCDAIKKRLPTSVIDCRPEEVVTGILEVNLLVGQGLKKERRFVYKGKKEQISQNVEGISQQVEKAYNQV